MAEIYLANQSRGGDTDDDSISVTSTVPEAYTSDQEFEVESILAEKIEDGENLYLISWTGYPAEQSTWEPKKHIKDSAILDAWTDDKMRQDRGLMQRFDVREFERKVEQIALDKAARRRHRKAKRRQMGLSVSPTDSEPEFWPQDSDSSDEAVKNNAVEELLPQHNLNLSRRKPKTLANPSKVPILDEDSDSEDVPLSKRLDRTQPQAARKTGRVKTKEQPRPSSSESDVPLIRGQHERMKNIPNAALGNRPEIPKSPALASNPRTVSPPEPSVRRRGRPAGRGASSTSGKGATRGGSTLGQRNVFASGETRKKRVTLIENASNPSIGPKHFKNLHQVRKAQLAGREVADVAPDLSAIPGGLFDPTKPMAYKSLKPAILRRPSATTKDMQQLVEPESSGTATSLMRESVTRAESETGSRGGNELFVGSRQQRQVTNEAVEEPGPKVPWQLRQPDDFYKQVCFYWHTNGHCTKRDGECKFLHTHEGNFPIVAPPLGYVSHRARVSKPHSSSEPLTENHNSTSHSEGSRSRAMEEPPNRVAPWQQAPPGPHSMTCYFWYSEGNCKRGSSCKFLHFAAPEILVAPPPGMRNKIHAVEPEKEVGTDYNPSYNDRPLYDDRPACDDRTSYNDIPSHNDRPSHNELHEVAAQATHPLALNLDIRAVCRFWESTGCRYTAKECRYKHGYDPYPHEAPDTAARQAIMARQKPAEVQNGTPTAPRTKSVSFAIEERTQIFEEPESFVGSDKPETTAGRDGPAQGQKIVCPHWLRGDCRHGSFCWNRHEAQNRKKLPTHLESSTRPQPSTSNDSTCSPLARSSTLQDTVEQQRLALTIGRADVANLAGAEDNLSPPFQDLQDSTPDPKRKRTKMSMDTYKRKKTLKYFGGRTKEVVFGGFSSQAAVIDFGDIGPAFQQPWGQAFSNISSIKLDRMCMAQDVEVQSLKIFKRILQHSSIAPDPSDSEAPKMIAKVVDHLRLLSAGLLSVFPEFVILVYPVQMEEWKFLEDTSTLARDCALRYLVYETDLDTNLIDDRISSQYSNAQLLDANNYRKNLVKIVHNLSFKSFLPGTKHKPDSPPHFYLLFPSGAHATADFLINWIRASRADSKIYTSQTQGSWKHFTNIYNIEAAAVFIHESAIPLVSELTSWTSLAQKGGLTFWCVSDSSALSSPYPARLSNTKLGSLSLTRLLPHGHVFLLTPSFLVAEPDRSYEIISWFLTHKLKQASLGTWKLACCRNLLDYLLDLALQKAEERDAFNVENADKPAKDAIAQQQGLSWQSCENRFSTHSLLIEHFGGSFSDISASDANELECPFIFADKYIDCDDEQALVTWFAGWALTKLDLYRRFTVVGTDQSSSKRASRMKAASRAQETPESRRLSPARSPQPENRRPTRFSGGPASLKEEVSDEIIFKNSAAIEQKKRALAVAAKLNAASPTRTPQTKTNSTQPSTMLPPNPNNVVEPLPDPTTKAPISEAQLNKAPSHGIVPDLPKVEFQFISMTGANKGQAPKYLARSNNNLDAAIALFNWENGEFDTAMDTDSPVAVQANAGHAAQAVQESDISNSAARDSVRFDLPPPKSFSHSGSGSDSRPTSRSGIRTDKDGSRCVRTSPLPPGSERSEKRVRPGFIPKEDVYPYRARKGDEEGRRSERRGSVGASGGSEDGEMNGKGNEPRESESADEGEVIMKTFRFEPTTVWYKRLKDRGEAYEHLLVEGWEGAFKVLRVGANA